MKYGIVKFRRFEMKNLKDIFKTFIRNLYIKLKISVEIFWIMVNILQYVHREQLSVLKMIVS